MTFLGKRTGFLDGVVFCGGEPTAHHGLVGAMNEVRSLGFEVALHTAGMNPEGLLVALPACDWVAMDVKAPFDRYESITRVKDSGAAARESVQAILRSGKSYEFRTTVHEDLISEENLMELAQDIASMGVRHYAVQAFREQGCRDEALLGKQMVRRSISQGTHEKLSRLFQTFVSR